MEVHRQPRWNGGIGGGIRPRAPIILISYTPGFL